MQAFYVQTQTLKNSYCLMCLCGKKTPTLWRGAHADSQDFTAEP